MSRIIAISTSLPALEALAGFFEPTAQDFAPLNLALLAADEVGAPEELSFEVVVQDSVEQLRSAVEVLGQDAARNRDTVQRLMDEQPELWDGASTTFIELCRCDAQLAYLLARIMFIHRQALREIQKLPAVTRKAYEECRREVMEVLHLNRAILKRGITYIEDLFKARDSKTDLSVLRAAASWSGRDANDHILAELA